MSIIGFSDIKSIDHDVVVVGAGFAGQVVARRLADHGMRVLLIEQGNNQQPGDDGGNDYRLEIGGLPYPETGTRLASLGGTSNHWNGQSHPISRTVFEGREGYPPWPINWLDYA